MKVYRGKIGFTEDDSKSRHRQYTKKNRDLWRGLGFRMLTAQVHDDDRDLVLAEMETRKCQRVAAIAEDGASTVDTLQDIASRNMAANPGKDERKQLVKDAKTSAAKREVSHFIEQHDHYRRKHTAINNKFSKDYPYETQVRMQAKGVAYINLAAAYFRLARARIDHAAQKHVFGLRGDDAAPEGWESRVFDDE